MVDTIVVNHSAWGCDFDEDVMMMNYFLLIKQSLNVKLETDENELKI